ncbi:MAG: hypothetical protein M1829_003197 [Trizodia sp. TS-e1964]|nr:MAG: hypothetical protein M1829_003197 [Trizodia sp. TS-e1964]
MNVFRQLGRRLFSSVPSLPRIVNGSGFVLLDPSTKIEEERMPAYDKGLYYPFRLGDVYSSRYQVLSKLGFGANATVWFCRDLQGHRYIVLKVYIHTSGSNREVEVLSHLSTTKSSHPGSAVVRIMMDLFDIDGPKGKHQFIVHEVLLTSLLHFQATFNPPRLSEDLVRGVVQQLLFALDFLHTEAQVIHTEEQTEPSARKVDGDKVVYQSQPFYRKGNLRRFALPILSDFGEARIGDPHHGIVQPDIYRAPEVVLGMEWTSKVDIWNVGVLIWDLLEGYHLFDAQGLDGTYSDTQHLAEMIGMLGPPPLQFLRRSSESQKYWNDEGKWKGLVDVPQNSLEDSEKYLEGKKKKLFMQFIRKMLQWDPEKRQSARELLTDSWLDIEA